MNIHMVKKVARNVSHSALADLLIYREYAHGQAVMRIDVVKSLGILFAKQKQGRTFKFDKQKVIDFTKTSN